jgi:asparagine synthase (glutamine-hydrolysing)
VERVAVSRIKAGRLNVCGIAGSWRCGFNVAGAIKRIIHRGPDGSAIAAFGDAIHGHARLAVLDLSTASSQPFRYGGGVLSYNGELWNFEELRDELCSLGKSFNTTGDTEVVAAALDEWGTDAVRRLDGMFAFAWTSGREAILARDRFGKIPLHVSAVGEGFAWSSELKGMGNYAGHSRPLPPASWLDLNSGTISRYYVIPDAAPPPDVIGMLRRGVKRRLTSDAPLCCLCSGGLDSTLILALAMEQRKDIVAYTAFVDGESEDLSAARSVCTEFGVELREVKVDEPTPASLAAAAVSIECEMKAQVEIAALCIPLAKAIASDGFKVCLSGEAADELFGGYGNMAIKASGGGDPEWRRIRLDQLEKMSRGNFMRCNKAFMAGGVECRLPFMERQLVESILASSKKECPPGKRMLKDAARGIIPEFVIKRTKETFQGASGMASLAGRAVASPRRYYASEVRKAYGAGASLRRRW